MFVFVTSNLFYFWFFEVCLCTESSSFSLYIEFAIWNRLIKTDRFGLLFSTAYWGLGLDQVDRRDAFVFVNSNLYYFRSFEVCLQICLSTESSSSFLELLNYMRPCLNILPGASDPHLSFCTQTFIEFAVRNGQIKTDRFGLLFLTLYWG